MDTNAPMSTATIETPSATPTPTATANAMPMTTPNPTPMVSSGGGNRSFMDILKSFNYLEIGFGILGSATLYYMIYYYRYNMINSKKFQIQTENKIDELEIKISDLSSSIQSKQTQQQQDIGAFGGF
jgi:hypothetical protein